MFLYFCPQAVHDAAADPAASSRYLPASSTHIIGPVRCDGCGSLLFSTVNILFRFYVYNKTTPPNIRTEACFLFLVTLCHCVTCKTCVLGESRAPPLFAKNSSMADEALIRKLTFVFESVLRVRSHS